jgi:hypothetical protein
MGKIISSLIGASLCVIATLAWAASTSINIGINVTSSSQSTITGLTLSNTSYTSSAPGTAVGNLVLSGANNSATTFTLSGPDAARFQLSSPCNGTSCSLEASGVEPDGYHDGKFLVFITPTLAGAKGSGVVYPFVINETVSCDETVASGGTQTEIANAISAAPTNGVVCFADAGTFTISSTVTVHKAVRLTGVNAKTMPAITVPDQIIAFDVTAANVKIDHLNATASLVNVGPNTDVCGGFAEFIQVEAVSSFTAAYNKSSSFTCQYLFFGTTNATVKYSYMSNDGAAGIGCVPCISSTFSNNFHQDMAPTSISGEYNAYPFTVSSSALSNTVIFQNNTAINDPVWECYDNHGGTNIQWLNNFCLAPGSNTAFNAAGNGGQPLTNSNQGKLHRSRHRRDLYQCSRYGGWSHMQSSGILPSSKQYDPLGRWIGMPDLC